MRLAIALVLAFALAGPLGLGSGAARACSTCASGDATLTVMGGEKPYAGRLRGSLALSHASVQSGGPGAHVGVDEWRLEAGLGWAPSDRFALALSAPLVVRDLDFGAAGRDDVTALGDPTVMARVVVFTDRPFRARHLVSLSAGLSLPLAPTRRYPSGAAMIPEQQPGAGALELLGGVAWDAFLAPWSFHLGVAGAWTSSARGGTRASRALTVATSLQRQLGARVALRAALELRLTGLAFDQGRAVPEARGAILVGGGDVLLAPVGDVTFTLGVRVPLLEAFDGVHAEGVALQAGLTCDFR